ncbi:DMT family transporter [Pseudomonas sp. MAFF212428]|uniref:DMT family transporter n=1 Tax=Pseudomonas brassicae TaxID=2708063 RepID=A0A6B3NHR4_9PSED|nr:DMT family transporter [Pseudomonas brassicae]NER61073.1 DMT family transporter [Pseudomonas brassicae]NER62795.1 DMT family transporter [Pseudomonas brassicae]
MFRKAAALVLIPSATALLAGALLPFQAASNAALGKALGHPLWGALTSLMVSAVVVVIALLALRVAAPDISRALQGSWWLWIGGVVGALYVVSAAAITPQLGASGFLLLVVAGQIVASLLVDHFGLMGLAGKPITFARLAGVVLIFGGVLLVQGVATSTAEPGTARVGQ